MTRNSVGKSCVFYLVIAAAALICIGCKENCSTFRTKLIGDIGWDKLQKTTCLSAIEKKTLVDERALYQRTNLVDLLETRSVEDVLQQATIQPVGSDELLAEIAKASSTIQQAQQPRSGPWVISRAVLFLYERIGGNARTAPMPAGTAFIVSVPQLNNPGFFRFLITARHLVDPLWAKCDRESQLSIRFTRKDGSGTALEPLNLHPKLGKILYVPKDPHLDLAAIVLKPKLFPKFNDYEVLDVPFRIAATPSDMNIVREGTKVIMAVLDPDLPGANSNSPLFRDGIISRKSDEYLKAVAPCGSIPIEVQSELLSAPLYGGSSGAPIFVTNGRGGNQPVLVGIQSLTFQDKHLAGFTPATDLVSLIKDASVEMKAQLDLYQGIKKE